MDRKEKKNEGFSLDQKTIEGLVLFGIAFIVMTSVLAGLRILGII